MAIGDAEMENNAFMRSGSVTGGRNVLINQMKLTAVLSSLSIFNCHHLNCVLLGFFFLLGSGI